MKRVFLFMFLVAALVGCGASPEISKKPVENRTPVSDREKETVAAHSVDKQKEAKSLPTVKPVDKSDTKTKWTRSGDPIDTSKFDELIEKAEKKVKAGSNDTVSKEALAAAYFKRGFALTEARQYASAIGDYRRALKYVPEHVESKKWIATIAGIYKSMNRAIPKEGDEPKPLEFKNEKSAT